MYKKGKYQYIVMIFLCVFYVEKANSQVGIGTTSPDESAILDVVSTNQGVLLPRMTTPQRNSIVNPYNGLIIYNISTNCLEINKGTPLAPDWECTLNTLSVAVDCDTSGFLGNYYSGHPLTAANTFSMLIINNENSNVDFTFNLSDLTLEGISGLSVSSVNPSSVTLTSGDSQLVEYTLSGTPSSAGELIGTWTNGYFTCSSRINVLSGGATFTTPLTAYVVSVYDGTPVVDTLGVVNNTTFQIQVELPYTSGVGTYAAYTGAYILNNTGSGEGGDMNSFRLSFSGGTFSTSGSILATIEVDGDGSFNAEQQLFGGIKEIVQLDFLINGVTAGEVKLEAWGGILDRNFEDADHKFVYFPVTDVDGNTWLNNNLGANYSNMNHVEFDPFMQATGL